MPVQLPEKAKAIDAFEKRTTDRVKEVKLTVFVCGPAVFDEEGVESTNPGAIVRRFVSRRIEEEGHCYIWGEHLAPRGQGGKTEWIRRFNDADKEILFAVDEGTDLVVIFPYSSGSLAELGAFCTHTNIPRKLLVVFHKDYEKHRSFVVKALGKAARKRKAVIRFRDYASPEAVWTEVRRVLLDQQMVKTTALSHGPTN